MTEFSEIVRRSAQAAVAPSLLTTAALAIAGRMEDANATAPLNAVAHIPFGDKAFAEDKPSLKYTLTGAALNVAAVASWAALYELTFGRSARRGNAMAGLFGGPAISALAYITDYFVVPKRLTPGFEERLSGRSMFCIYAVLGATLPLASLLFEKRT
jgi:hypothetical protein